MSKQHHDTNESLSQRCEPASLQHQAVENLCNAVNYGGLGAPAPREVQRQMIATAVQQIVDAAVARARMAEGAH